MQGDSDYRKLPVPARGFANLSASRSDFMRFAMTINRYLLPASLWPVAAMLLLALALTPALAGEVDDETSPYVAPKRPGANTIGGVAPRNISSHSLEFFGSLLTGRVWVAHWPDFQGDEIIQNRVRAVYHGRDGNTSSCWYRKEKYNHRNEHWRMSPSRKRGVVNYWRAGTQPRSWGRGRTPVFYDPGSGRLHNEVWIERQVLWHRARVGWVQESWPRAMKDACPDLKLPADLAINEKQTSRFMQDLHLQDPDAPIRDFPGSDRLRTPGGIGIAQARAMGRLPLPTAELRKLFHDHHGNIFEGTSGRRYVLSFSENHSQLWDIELLGGITDIWNATSSHNKQLITWSSENTSKFYKYRVGYALGLIPTGKRHPAYLMTDILVAEGHALPLELWGREEKVRLAAGGALSATGGGAGAISGRWWWERGALHLDLGDGAPPLQIAWAVLEHLLAGITQ